MKSKFRILVFFLFILVSQDLWSQRGGPRSGARPSINVSGQVIDASTDQAIEFATVSLFSQRDSSIITGGITDMNGKFSINTRPGKFYVVVDFLSFASKTISEVMVRPQGGGVNLGVIALETDAELLDEVEVVAERSTTTFALDKKVFNVGKDLSRAGTTVVDVLENVPSVTVDIEGGVSLRGSQNVRILVDGKPSGLVGLGNANGLRSFPANLIERIEVITNPSARYEAEGMAGIINIVLKKTERQGFNGSIDVSAGLPRTAGVAFNFNYRKEKFNWFLNYGIRLNRNPGFGETESRLVAFDKTLNQDVVYFSDQRRDHLRGGLKNNLRFGSDYYFSDKDILTASLNYRRGDENNEVALRYFDVSEMSDGSLVDGPLLTDRFDDEVEKEDKLEFSLSYKKEFNKDHNWVTDFRYQDNRESESSDFTESYFDGNEVPLGIADSLQRSANDEGEQLIILQSDYTWPITKDNKFEAGVRTSFRFISNDFLVEAFAPNTGEWNSLAGLSNDFKYDENIYAAYLIYGNKINKFSYQIGLRSEYTDIFTELVKTSETNPREYIDLFPSAHINYAFSEKLQAQISYSRRINRPRFWDLNPFFTFSDARNFFSGNPNLDPEYTNAYEASMVAYLEHGSISSSVYYRRSTDVIRRTVQVEFDTNGEIARTVRMPENLDTRDDYGLEISGNYRIGKLNLNGNANFFRAITVDDEIGNADTYSWFARGSANMKITKSMDAQVSFNYRGAEETPQGRRKAIGFMDLGWSKDLLKNKATLTLSVRDLFNTRKRISITELDGFHSTSEFQWRSRIIQATFNYRINQKKKGKRSRGDFRGNGGEF